MPFGIRHNGFALRQLYWLAPFESNIKPAVETPQDAALYEPCIAEHNTGLGNLFNHPRDINLVASSFVGRVNGLTKWKIGLATRRKRWRAILFHYHTTEME